MGLTRTKTAAAADPAAQAALPAPAAPVDAPAGAPRPGRALLFLALVVVAGLVPLLGPAAALRGTSDASAPGAGLVTALRGVLFAALSVQAGEVYVRWLGRRIPGLPGASRCWSSYAAAAGALAAAGLVAVMNGADLVTRHTGDGMAASGLYGTRDGVLALLEVNAFVAAGLCARSRRPATQAIPLAVIACAEALRAHSPYEDWPLLGSGLTLVHLTCAALWAGGLLAVLRRLRRWRTTAPAAGAALLGRYARLAAVLLAGVTATGLISSLRRIPLDWLELQLLTTAYGRVLIAKLLVVAVVCLLALLARRRLRHSPDPLSAMQPARSELAALAAVVALSALLTAVPVPINW
ncbi:CopD family protein [Streptomyces boninensis]|uniref:CopD family protein n=1 Tax=Streptomyces boninensis TaxID=2039455 RepID=UPI003B223A13